ncbi:hypothetical protein ACIPRI_02365 [Variovorax sp. LARHSF232]
MEVNPRTCTCTCGRFDRNP